MRMGKRLAILASAVAVLGGVSFARADAAIMYNQDVSAGVFFGSGNSNGDWAVDTEGNIQLGLRGALRQQGPSPSDSSGLYGPFPIGRQTAPTANPNRAAWNYEFSIDTGAEALSSYLFQLCATFGGTTECVDPLGGAFGADNAIQGNAAQNSKQILFSDSPLSGIYNINASGIYSFTLSAYDGNDTGLTAALAQTAIDVAVPEPATLSLLGFGMAGFGFMRRRAKARRAA